MVLVSIARNPVPTGAISGHFKGYDGTALRFARWQSTSTRKKGTVCLFTGRSEFIEKYLEVVADLRRRGFAVSIMDWRGQGGSQRMLKNTHKGHVRNFAEYEKDVHCFMREVVLPDCPPPYFALAHSMGGHILMRLATEQNSWFDRIVLVSPMFQLDADMLPISQKLVGYTVELLSLFGAREKYIPGGNDTTWDEEPFEGNPLTSDETRYMRAQAILETAPELGIGSPTVSWMQAACRSMAEVADLEFPSRVHIPVLMIAAGSDKIVSTSFTEDFAIRLKVGSHLVIPRARHEILQERDELRLQFWAAFDAYIPGFSDIKAIQT